jgi:hypothetical protein
MRSPDGQDSAGFFQGMAIMIQLSAFAGNKLQRLRNFSLGRGLVRLAWGDWGRGFSCDSHGIRLIQFMMRP